MPPTFNAVNAFAGDVSERFTTPFAHPLGTKARDAAGNEYVLCTVGAGTGLAPEMCVVIGADFTITAVSATSHRGPIGVIADYTKIGLTSAYTTAVSSAQALWVQIYGRAFVQCSTGGDSSPSEAITTLQTTVMPRFRPVTSGATTPVGNLLLTSANVLTTVALYYIDGMTVADDVTVGEVSAVCNVSPTHSGARAAVWLNYPKIEPQLTVPGVT